MYLFFESIKYSIKYSFSKGDDGGMIRKVTPRIHEWQEKGQTLKWRIWKSTLYQPYWRAMKPWRSKQLNQSIKCKKGIASGCKITNFVNLRIKMLVLFVQDKCLGQTNFQGDASGMSEGNLNVNIKFSREINIFHSNARTKHYWWSCRFKDWENRKSFPSLL